MISKLCRYLILPLLGIVATASAEAQVKRMPSPKNLSQSAKCVYGIFKPIRSFKLVEAYVVDDFRMALEYTFKAKNGHNLIGDLVLTEVDEVVTYSVNALHNETTEAGFEELEFILKTDFASRCHLIPAGDHLIPFPKHRREWKRANFNN